MNAVKYPALLLMLMFGLMLSIGVYADEKAREDNYNLGSNGLAIKGYDPVAYHVQGKPMKGQKRIDFKYKGVTYYFASQDNLNKFKANPAKYEPAYGGWCAYAVANDSKAGVDPKTFKIVDGRLMLFYNSWGTNTLKKWNEKNEGEQVKKADAYWKKISGEDAPKK